MTIDYSYILICNDFAQYLGHKNRHSRSTGSASEGEFQPKHPLYKEWLQFDNLSPAHTAAALLAVFVFVFFFFFVNLGIICN